MTGLTPDPQAGASIWERVPQAQWLPSPTGQNPPSADLYAYLTSHVEAENELLVEYREAVDRTPSRALRYMTDILMEDEVRHHRIFTELVESLGAEEALRSEGHWVDEDTAVPHNDFFQLDASERSSVVDLTNRLIHKEQEDRHELKRLGRELRDAKDSTLWSLLIDLMERDCDRHIAILRFAKKHASWRL